MRSTAGLSSTWRLFAGKGGVGKTTCAAASAIDAAARGARVLVVSTDPAHSLGDALARKLGPKPSRITVPGATSGRGSLHACELDAPAALARWIDERRAALVAAATRGTLLDAAEAERLLHLALPGADELVGLLEVDRLARDGRHDLVVIDAAPTGHTLRLLDAPGSLARLARVLDSLLEKDRWIAERFGRGHRKDASDALVDELESSASELTARLRDRTRCLVSWVLVPEDLPIAETREGVRALEAMGVPVGDVVLNRFTSPTTRCASCLARAGAERESLRALLPLLAGRTLRVVPGLELEPRGVEALRAVAERLRTRADPTRLADAAPRKTTTKAARRAAPRELSSATPAWLAPLATPERRLLLFGGKGGVGKTSCAAAVALALAQTTPAREVLLLSVDPAHSTSDALELSRLDHDPGSRPVPGVKRLSLRELDARAAFARARERWRGALDELFEAIAGGGLGATLDSAADELVDLAPPGLDELLGALEVVDDLLGDPAAGQPPACDLLVVDTPPTGHALRLLEAPALALEWMRACLRVLRDHGALGELARDLTETAARLRRLQELLEDPARTGFVVVTRAGALPTAETGRLLQALERLRVPVPAVIVNDLLPEAAAGARCARCKAEASAQAGAVTAVARLRRGGAAGGRWAIIRAPRATPRPPRGSTALGAWGLSWQVDAEPAARRSVRPRRARPPAKRARRAR